MGEDMGIIITWSMIFWVFAAVIAIWGLGWFLLKVAYVVARDENAQDVSTHPKTPAPDKSTTEFREATVEAFRKKVPEFGRRRSLPPNPPPRSLLHRYKVAGVAETWKHHGAAALNKMALLHKGHGLQHRFGKGLKAFRRIANRSGRFIFVQSSGFSRRLAESWKHHGTAALNKMPLLQKGHGLQHRFRKGLKVSRRIASRSGRFIFMTSGGLLRRLTRGVRKVRPLFLRQLGRG
jgi:hypothetical protein